MVTWTSINKRLIFEREQELKERGQLIAGEWASVDALLRRMKDLTELSVRVSASLTRTDFADPEPGEEEVTPDLNSPVDEVNLASGVVKWVIRPE